jgi:tetratricopeptide (TPR) repeat protein
VAQAFALPALFVTLLRGALGGAPYDLSAGDRAIWAPAKVRVGDQDPDEKDIWSKIDRRIQGFASRGKKATLGLLQELISDSISFGAPAFNRGDVEECSRFYIKTAESILAAFKMEKSATKGAGQALADLQAAVARSAQFPRVERKAWALRFAFDKILLAWQIAASHAKGLVIIGNQNFSAGNYPEAADSFRESLLILEDLVGQDLDQIEIATRASGLMLGHALLSDAKYEESARALEAGVKYIPDWPRQSFDFRKLFRADQYEECLKSLQGAAGKDGAKADVHFLLGYVFHFTGKKEDAKVLFEKALRLNPAHVGAQQFLGGSPKAKEY